MKIALPKTTFLAAGAISLFAGCTTRYLSEPLDPRRILEKLDEMPPEGLRLSLPQAQAIAILRHPSLEKLRAERGIAGAAEIRAESRPDPELSLSPLWIVPEATLGAVASLRWELLPSGAREVRRGLSGALRKAIDAEVAAAEWRAAQDARVAWLGLVRAQRAVELGERAVSLARDARDFGRAMLERSAARDVDVAVLELDLAESEREAVSAKAAVKTARESLARAIGLPPPSTVETAFEGDPFEPLEPQLPPGNADEALLARLPELREARARYLVAERELELAHLGGLAKVSIGPDVQRDADNTFLGGGTSVTIPWTDANRAGIAEAKTRREMAARAYEQSLFEARAALAKARVEEEALSLALAKHESEVAPRARETLEATQRALEAGVADLLSLFLAREKALRAERTTFDLRAARAIAVARLEAAFGPEPIKEEGRLAENSSTHGGVR